jgi:effector-binding domain-containing protein
VPPGIRGKGRIKSGTLPGGEVVSTVHVGAYDHLPDAGAALAAWAEAHGRAATGPNWELYVTDPGVEPDPTQWKTEVIKPLAPCA